MRQINKTKYIMKSFKHLLSFCFLAMLASCSEDAFVPQSEVVPTAEGGSVDYISMTVPDIEIADATTRSKFIDDDTELKFVWQEDDAIGVVPMAGRPLSFPIHAENIQKNTAVFDGGGWALKTSEKYAAFYPYKKNNYEKDIKTLSRLYRSDVNQLYGLRLYGYGCHEAQRRSSEVYDATSFGHPEI